MIKYSEPEDGMPPEERNEDRPRWEEDCSHFRHKSKRARAGGLGGCLLPVAAALLSLTLFLR